MKINSEHLWKYINELATNEKVKFNVYYDDQYVTQIYWNGESFEWEQGTFTSEAFFNPLYDFVVIEEEKKIPEKLEIINEKICKNNRKWKVKGEEYYYNISTPQKIIADKINQVIDYLKSKGE